MLCQIGVICFIRPDKISRNQMCGNRPCICQSQKREMLWKKIMEITYASRKV